MTQIKYCAGFKYQLAENYSVATPITGYSIKNSYFQIDPDGRVTVFAGYAWDGASGPTFDTKNSMRASLIHDVFCQCMRDQKISYVLWQDLINDVFRNMCIEDGMSSFRAWFWHFGVNLGDAGNPGQGPDRKILVAP